MVWQAQLVKIRAALDAIESRLVNEGVSESLVLCAHSAIFCYCDCV